MSLMDTDLDAIERDWPMTNRPEGEVIAALVRELREARRERDEAMGDLEKIHLVYLALYEQDPRAQNYQEVTIVREPDGVEFVLTVQRKEGKTPGAVAAEARAALAASRQAEGEAMLLVESAEHKAGEAIARAGRAEAACAQMRPLVDAALRFAGSLSAKQDQERHDALIEAAEAYERHGATDVGSGYVDPQTHAAVVNDCIRWKTMAGVLTKERDEARSERSSMWQRFERGNAKLAECQAQLAEVRATLELLKSTPLGRVQLLEAVATTMRPLVERVEARIASNTKFTPASQGGVDGRVYEDARDALAALAAHDKQEGRHE